MEDKPLVDNYLHVAVVLGMTAFAILMFISIGVSLIRYTIDRWLDATRIAALKDRIAASSNSEKEYLDAIGDL